MERPGGGAPLLVLGGGASDELLDTAEIRTPALRRSARARGIVLPVAATSVPAGGVVRVLPRDSATLERSPADRLGAFAFGVAPLAKTSDYQLAAARRGSRTCAGPPLLLVARIGRHPRRRPTHASGLLDSLAGCLQVPEGTEASLAQVGGRVSPSDPQIVGRAALTGDAITGGSAGYACTRSARAALAFAYTSLAYALASPAVLIPFTLSIFAAVSASFPSESSMSVLSMMPRKPRTLPESGSGCWSSSACVVFGRGAWAAAERAYLGSSGSRSWEKTERAG